ncbi:MAG: histidine phosphatase family protein [Azospirillaceae bacterium]
MTDLVLVRHGPTDWNAEHRIQGHTDIPLSDYGRLVVAGWRIPVDFAGYDWITSPLARARETARLLGREPPSDDRLREQSWGAWEGRTLPELRRADAAGVEMIEAQGLDFRPPEGESPRELQARLMSLTAEIAAAGRPTVAVCHKGVIRALYALATGWSYRPPMPDRLDDDCCFHFRLAPDGRPTVAGLNIPLT